MNDTSMTRKTDPKYDDDLVNKRYVDKEIDARIDSALKKKILNEPSTSNSDTYCCDYLNKDSLLLSKVSTQEPMSWTSRNVWTTYFFTTLQEQKGTRITHETDHALIGEGVFRVRAFSNLVFTGLSSGNWLMMRIARERNGTKESIVSSITNGGSWSKINVDATFDVQEGDKIYVDVRSDSEQTVNFYDYYVNFDTNIMNCFYIEKV